MCTSDEHDQPAGDQRDGLDRAPADGGEDRGGQRPASRSPARSRCGSRPWRRSTSMSLRSRSATSSADLVDPRLALAASTTSPSRKNEKPPTSASASSVVSSRPRLPGVRRSWLKRAAKSATAATGLSSRCQTGRRDLRQHAPAGPVVALVDPVAHLRARLRAAPQVDQRDDPGDQRDQRAEREQAARDVGRELVDRAPEHEAERAERDRPQRRRRARRRAGSGAAASARRRR